MESHSEAVYTQGMYTEVNHTVGIWAKTRQIVTLLPHSSIFFYSGWSRKGVFCLGLGPGVWVAEANRKFMFRSPAHASTLCMRVWPCAQPSRTPANTQSRMHTVPQMLSRTQWHAHIDSHTMSHKQTKCHAHTHYTTNRHTHTITHTHTQTHMFFIGVISNSFPVGFCLYAPLSVSVCVCVCEWQFCSGWECVNPTSSSQVPRQWALH